MYFYMSGCFRNEFLHNSYALGVGVTYSSLSNQYDYYLNCPSCVAILFALGFFYKCLWLLSLRMHSLFKRRAVLQRVYGARRKARKIIKAGLRWRDNYSNVNSSGSGGSGSGASSPHNNHAGVVSLEDEALAELEFSSAFHIP